MKRKISNIKDESLKGMLLAMLATLLARAIGFMREIFVASEFGTSTLGDAFTVAFSIPEILG